MHDAGISRSRASAFSFHLRLLSDVAGAGRLTSTMMPLDIGPAFDVRSSQLLLFRTCANCATQMMIPSETER